MSCKRFVISLDPETFARQFFCRARHCFARNDDRW